jgi:hypothetical protein
MKGWLGLALLALGVVLAASAGSRNGERHVEYRKAEAEFAVAKRADDTHRASIALNQQLAAEGVDFSKLSVKQVVDLFQTEGRLKKQFEASEASRAELKAWGLEGTPGEALHGAQRRRAAIGLPPPQERVRQWADVGALGWVAGLLLIVAGALLARQQIALEQAGHGPSAAGRVDFERSVREAIVRLEAIGASIAELPMDDDAPEVRAELDRLAAEVLDPVVEGRGQLVARHGIGGFAEYFGAFSSAERNVNRVWSALTDGHAVVARESVQVALVGFRAALDAWAVVEQRRLPQAR